MVLNSESRALRAVDDLEVAGEHVQVSADGYAGSAGISMPVPEVAVRDGASIPFRMKLTLVGSSRLTFLPLARKADIAIQSKWPDPGFEGAPAPLDPVITDKGFSARWSVAVVLEKVPSMGVVWRGPAAKIQVMLSERPSGWQLPQLLTPRLAQRPVPVK